MNLAQNKFLVGLGAVVLVGAGALGYLTWNASTQYAATHEAYEKLANEYIALQKLPLYPNAENLKKLEEGREQVNVAAEALQAKLASVNLPLEEISPEQFQDRLRATVSAVTERADGSGVALPANFYLGFDRYQSQPPKTELAPLLWRQLKAIELAVDTLISSRVSAITGLTRQPLPGEDGAAAAPAAPQRKPRAAAKPAAAAAGAPLVSEFPFQLSFTAEQAQFRRALNELVANPKQFFIVQPLLVENQNLKPTPRAVAGLPGAVAPLPGGVPHADATSATRERETYVVGTEKVNVVLRLQMVIFGGSQTAKSR